MGKNIQINMILSDLGYFLKVEPNYPEQLGRSHNELAFLPEKKKIGKFGKPFCKNVKNDFENVVSCI